MTGLLSSVVLSVSFLIINVNCGPSPYANSYPYNGGFSIAGGNSGLENHESTDASGFIKNRLSDQGNALKQSQDVGKFYNLENESKGHDIAHNKQGISTDKTHHTTGENFETDKSHNRNHIKSGFHNSYHKDESGNNSSYYENSDDRGGKIIYDKKQGTRGDAYDSKFNEGVKDGAVRDRYDDRSGGYDTRGSHDRQHMVAEDQGELLLNRLIDFQWREY